MNADKRKLKSAFICVHLRLIKLSPIGFATNSPHVDRRAFDAFDTDTFACFERQLAERGIRGPRRSKPLYRTFLERSLTRRNDSANFTRQRVHAAAQRFPRLLA